MKKFEVPTVEVVRLVEKDIITSSTCVCVDCTVCPPGSNNCTYYDTCPTYTGQ